MLTWLGPFKVLKDTQGTRAANGIADSGMNNVTFQILSQIPRVGATSVPPCTNVTDTLALADRRLYIGFKEENEL